MRPAAVLAFAAALLAAPGFAQQPAAQVPLGDVARQSEAERPTVKKAKKTYTNADLSADPRGETPPAAATTDGGLMSASLNKPVSAEEVIARSEAVAETAAAGALSEQQWRQRADSQRLQIDRLQKRMAALTRPNPARDANAGAKARNDAEVAKVQVGLDALIQSWTRLEDFAKASKIPTEWLDPRPSFTQQ